MPTIANVTVYPVRLPVLRSFGFASGSATVAGGAAPHLFVKLEDSEGQVGWGEGRPVPSWSYETPETLTSTVRDYLGPAIIGLPVSDRWELHRRMHRAIGRGPSTGQPIAKAALDMALHDLLARRAGLSLRAFLGGDNGRNYMALSYTLTAHTAAEVADEMQEALAEGFLHVNFKAAVSPATDVAVARVICDLRPPGGFVWADANQGFTLHEARRIAAHFSELGVDVLEQPLAADQFAQMRALRQATRLPLAVDESSVSPADFFHYAAAGLVDYLVVKVTRSGGIWPTLQQIAVAEAAGLPFLVSGLTDGLLTKMAVCQTALAFGFAGPAALNGSQFTDESAIFPDKARWEFGGAVHLDETPGIGVTPDEGALRELAVNER